MSNIEFALGADVNTDNTTLGSAKRSIQGGLQADFRAPYTGFLNIAVFAYKEWQHDGFASTFPFEPIPESKRQGGIQYDLGGGSQLHAAARFPSIIHSTDL